MLIEPRALDLAAIEALAIGEAIGRLAFVKVSARAPLLAMLTANTGEHPRSLCTAYRKRGEQLSHKQLKAIGLRANAFMSVSAFDDLTDAGRAEPLRAHEVTLLRAYFTVSRWRSIRTAEMAIADGCVKASAVRFTYDMLPPVCAQCQEMDGTQVTMEDASIVPPNGCECVTANYAIQMRIDWLSGVI